MKKLVVFIDCDDTVYVCNQYAIDKLNAADPTAIQYKITDIKSWGLTGTRLDERFKYFSDPNFVATQPLMDGAQEFIRELSKIAEVYFLTAVPAEVLSARAMRIMQDFSFIPQDHIILSSAKHLMKADILLDDAPHNIENSIAKYPVLFRRPWNTDVTGVMSVNNYNDFLSFVKQVLNSNVSPSSLSKNGGVLCLVGASGSGKQEITDELCKAEGFERIKNYTTKPTADSNHYTVIDEANFFELDFNGMLVEKSAYGGFHYGVPKGVISSIIQNGNIAVIPIDICGAVTLRGLYPQTVFAYVEKDKASMLTALLEDDMSNEEKVKRIIGMDREKQNKALCDFVVDANSKNAIEKIITKIK